MTTHPIGRVAGGSWVRVDGHVVCGRGFAGVTVETLEDALGLRLVSRNATDGTSLPRISHEERAWYTDRELAQLFEATAGGRFHALWVVLGRLGLRLGEALGLK
jgi:hypothetical protein